MAGATIAETCWRRGIAAKTYYPWKRRDHGIQVAGAKKWKGLDDDIRGLERLMASLFLDNAMLRDRAAGKWWRPPYVFPTPLDRIGAQLYTASTLMAKDVDGTLTRVAEISYREVTFAGVLDGLLLGDGGRHDPVAYLTRLGATRSTELSDVTRSLASIRRRFSTFVASSGDSLVESTLWRPEFFSLAISRSTDRADVPHSASIVVPKGPRIAT